MKRKRANGRQRREAARQRARALWERHEKVNSESAEAMRKALPDDLDRRGQQKRIAWIQEQIRLAKRADPLGGYRFEDRRA